LNEFFKTVKPRRVTEEIVEQLLDLIGQGVLAPGQRLPSEREMARSMGVSRPTLREALKRLEYVGHLDTVQGGGSYVRDVVGAALRDPLTSLVRDTDAVSELAEFRTNIETWAAAMAALRAEPQELMQLKEIVDKMESLLAGEQPQHQLDAEFHQCLAKATHNRIYLHVARTVCHLFFEIVRISHENIFTTFKDQKALFEEHLGIYRALENRDAAAARERMYQHLFHTEQWFKKNLSDWTGRETNHEKKQHH
jgi:GntR family transcriptional repressor for pyruvate dehydrogenase complex